MENRPTFGMSVGGIAISPPGDVTFFAVASQLLTPKYTNGNDGAFAAVRISYHHGATGAFSVADG